MRRPQSIATSQQGKYTSLFRKAVDGRVKVNAFPQAAIRHRESFAMPKKTEADVLLQQRHAAGRKIAQIYTDA